MPLKESSFSKAEIEEFESAIMILFERTVLSFTSQFLTGEVSLLLEVKDWLNLCERYADAQLGFLSITKTDSKSRKSGINFEPLGKRLRKSQAERKSAQKLYQEEVFKAYSLALRSGLGEKPAKNFAHEFKAEHFESAQEDGHGFRVYLERILSPHQIELGAVLTRTYEGSFNEFLATLRALEK